MIEKMTNSTYSKSKNIAGMIYYILGILFFLITLLIIFGVLNMEGVSLWFKSWW